ncbi:hypothetical protein [Pannonibacter carbonis]|uniref:hypothetical protein n=1 Tax=Pannonibacter carbonis TaxID=2067569 RepID=UPI000D0F188E|nr:hypothetical protein [Pannonibacter carbonis]
MSLLFFSPRSAQPAPSNTGDWRQQELAEIYRVLHLLQQNGLGVDLDRGVTDRNEPWAVFFDPTGDDVFLHLARLSGEYIMVSEPLNVKVKARNFRQAVDQFEAAISGKLQQNRERPGNVVSHPAAQLLFSLVAVFLVVKSKAAQAHEGDDDNNGFNEISHSQLAKIRAVLTRLQESVDNPVMMAAMVGAIVVTAGLVRDDLNKDISADEAHSDALALDHSRVSDKITLADASEQIIRDVDSRIVAGEEPQQASVSGDGSPRHLADLQVARHDTNIQAAKIQDASTGETVAVTQSAHDENTASNVAASSGGNATGRPASAAEQTVKSSGSASGSSSDKDIADSVSSSAIVLVAAAQAFQSSVPAGLSFDSKAMVAVTIGADAAEVLPIVATSDTVNAVTSFDSSAPSTILSLKDNSSQLLNSLPGADANSLVRSIVTAFEQVNVYSYGPNFLFVVDTDVVVHEGDQIAFVNTQFGDDITISFIGTRAAFDAAGVFIA